MGAAIDGIMAEAASVGRDEGTQRGATYEAKTHPPVRKTASFLPILTRTGPSRGRAEHERSGSQLQLPVLTVMTILLIFPTLTPIELTRLQNPEISNQ
jgi:hypothetical protein